MTKPKDQKPKTEIVVGLLLAAGQSKRMGAFKPLLPFGSTTVIHSCINNLQAGGIDQIIVVGGRHANELRDTLAGLEQICVVVNPDPESEMGASIAYGVQSLPATARAVLIALADHPATPAEVIEEIVAAWRGGAKLIIPEFAGRGGHPVLIDLEFREQLLTLDPEQGLRGLFDANRDRVLRLKVDSSYIARDLDTWDDYRALHEDVFGTPPDTWTAD